MTDFWAVNCAVFRKKEVGDYYKNCISGNRREERELCLGEVLLCRRPEEPADEVRRVLIGHLYFV